MTQRKKIGQAACIVIELTAVGIGESCLPWGNQVGEPYASPDLASDRVPYRRRGPNL